MSEKKQQTLHPVDVYVGHKIRERRQKLNLSLVDMSDKLDISHQQIQKYEQGITRVSASMLYDIAKVFGVTIAYFYEGYKENASGGISNIPEKNDLIDFDKLRALNILLVEDDPSDEILTRKALDYTSCDANIHTVYDGVAALEFLRNKKGINNFPRPDIIFLDINIPKKDGVVVLRDIKRDSSLRDIPVIVLTNCINAHEMYEVYSAYASGFIAKSFDFKVFRENMVIVMDYWSKAVVLPYMH